MSKFVITAKQVEQVLNSTGYSSVKGNVQAVLDQLNESPALLTAYLANVIQVTKLPDPIHSAPLF